MKFYICNFQTDFSDSWLRHHLWNCPDMNITGLHWWLVNIGSGNGLVPSSNKPLPEPVLTQPSCHHMVSLGHNEFKGLITVGSYGNHTRVICCPAPGLPESAARGTSPPDNKSRGCCCHNSRPTVINPDYNMTKQLCINRIYDKIRSKLPPNRATSPTCLHCDITHLSLTTGVAALHIPSWRAGLREERRQALKTVWPVHAGR